MISLGPRLFVVALGLMIGGFAIWVFWFISKYGRLPGSDPSLQHSRPPWTTMKFVGMLFLVGAALIYMAIRSAN